MSGQLNFLWPVAAALALTACSSTVVRRSEAPVRPAVAPRSGASVEVKRGETLYGIASRRGLKVEDVAAWNGIAAPYTIYPGQRLRLSPDGKRAGNAAAARSGGAGSTATTGSRTASSAGASTRTGTDSRNRTPAGSATTAAAGPAKPISSDLKWRWPADGPLLTRFLDGEPTRQGVDIAGDGGAPVKAAADGVVVYSGSGLVGYGELIIVKHSDAWLSAYGHNRERMVNEGALVKAGQQIAVMGRTGAPRDMLHFEIRYNGKPVDPLLYLPKR